MTQRRARAIVLAAGMGTRMRSARPKVLHEVCGRPMVWHVLHALATSGTSDVVVVTNPVVEPLLAPLADFFGARTIVQERQLGTGHAVGVGLEALVAGDDDLLVAYGDMPLLTPQIFAGVLDALARDPANALALVTARMPLPSNFGRVIRHGDAVTKIVEARDCTPHERAVDEMNAGIYAYREARLRAVIGELSDANAQGEYYLTDTVALLLNRGHRVVPVPCDDHRLVLGVNDRVELAEAQRVLNRRLCEAHMRAGVTIVDPARTSLEPGLSIGVDSVILPNTAIGGASVLGERVTIGPNARLHDATIGSDSRVTESVVIATAIGAHVHVGPFAHLRGGNHVGDRVHIGNFVELKKTTMHAGAKAGHLTYLGDAEIGERANIGAGTITCNFDGTQKHPTSIGAGAFIGSNSSLVAPIRIGDHAVTGAGAVVIRDVADGERVVGNPARALLKKSGVSADSRA